MSDTIASENAEGVDSASADGVAGQRRLLLIVGGLAGLLVLGLAAYFLFLSGGSEDDLGALPAQGPAPSSADDGKQGDKKGDESKPESLPEKFDGEVGSDPFKPL